MAEPRTVRRLKGQPDRWRRGCDREHFNTNLRAVGGYSGAVTTAGDINDWFIRFGEQAAQVMAGLPQALERIMIAVHGTPREQFDRAIADLPDDEQERARAAYDEAEAVMKMGKVVRV